MTAPSRKFVPRRGRPTAAQVLAIEGALINTARQHFFASGFDGMAMEAVATELGISKGTLYGRYPSKEALFHAVVEDAVSRWSAESSKSDGELTDDIEQRLRYHARAIARSQVDPEVQAFQRIVAATAERFPAAARSMHEVGALYIINLIAADIRAAAERDGVPVHDPVDIATRIVSTMAGWHLQESQIREVGLDETFDFADRTISLTMAARHLW